MRGRPGWRLGTLTPGGALAGAVSLGFGQCLIAANNPALTLPYFVLTLVFYYGGITWYLGSSRPARLIARLGEAEALRRYRLVVALMFIHQGLGIGCVTALQGPQLPALPFSEAVAQGGRRGAIPDGLCHQGVGHHARRREDLLL